MPQIFHLAVEESTFTQMQLKPVSYESIQHLSQVVTMLLPVLTEDEDIVDVTFGKQ
jgi:hypothetical protein